MCIEDIRMGRRSYYRQTPVVLTASAVAEFPPARNRVGIAFGAGTSAIQVTPGVTAEVAVAGGFVGGGTASPYIFRVEEWGQSVAGPWIIVDGGFGSTVNVVEIFLEDK